MFAKLFSKSPQESSQNRFPEDQFTITTASVQNRPAIAMINCAYKKYAFGKEYPNHFEIEFDLEDQTNEGLTTNAEADVLNTAEDLLMDKWQQAGVGVHFIARQTWNGKRIIDCYTDNKDAAEATLKTCIEQDLFKRTCRYTQNNEPSWDTAKAFLKNF